MTDPRLYIVSYDVADDARRREIFERLECWGEHLQYSVFQCRIDANTCDEMCDALREVVHREDDDLLIFDLGPAAGRAEQSVISLTDGYEFPRREALVL
jgi:CRISPR-associated protein Cas2